MACTHKWKLLASTSGEICRAELHTCRNCYTHRHTVLMNEAHPRYLEKPYKKKILYIDFNNNTKERQYKNI